MRWVLGTKCYISDGCVPLQPQIMKAGSLNQSTPICVLFLFYTVLEQLQKKTFIQRFGCFVKMWKRFIGDDYTNKA